MDSSIYTLDYYNKKAKEFVGGTREIAFTDIQDTFLKNVTVNGKILDFGCGSGRDTKYFLNKGYKVDAIDGSAELCKIASEYTGIIVRQMLFEELSAIGEYDAIWACASILHVAKKELPDVLKKMAMATKDNGTVYMSFKYGDYEGMKDGRYFTYLTKESFVELLKSVPEFALDEIWVSSDVRTGREDERWLNVILRKRAMV